MNLLEKEDLIKVKAEELENASPEEIIRWAVETFPTSLLPAASVLRM